MSVKRIAKELGIAYGTAWNYVKGRKDTTTTP
jgi:molybdenum-dependent DNA-binding transcriptional regulator ModE